MTSKTENYSCNKNHSYMMEYTQERHLEFNKVRDKVLSLMKELYFSEELAKILLDIPKSLVEWHKLSIFLELQRDQSLEVEKLCSVFNQNKKNILDVLDFEIKALYTKIHKLELGFNESLSLDERCAAIDRDLLNLKNANLCFLKVQEATNFEEMQHLYEKYKLVLE